MDFRSLSYSRENPDLPSEYVVFTMRDNVLRALLQRVAADPIYLETFISEVKKVPTVREEILSQLTPRPSVSGVPDDTFFWNKQNSRDALTSYWLDQGFNVKIARWLAVNEVTPNQVCNLKSLHELRRFRGYGPSITEKLEEFIQSKKQSS